MVFFDFSTAPSIVHRPGHPKRTHRGLGTQLVQLLLEIAAAEWCHGHLASHLWWVFSNETHLKKSWHFMKKHSNVQHIAIKNKWGAPDQQTNRVLGFVTAILGMKSCRNSRDQWRFPKMELPQNHGCFNTKSRSSMTCLDDLGCPYDKTEPSVKSWMFHSNPSIISIKSPYILPSPGSRTCCCFILPRESSVWSCDGGGFFLAPRDTDGLDMSGSCCAEFRNPTRSE